MSGELETKVKLTIYGITAATRTRSEFPWRWRARSTSTKRMCSALLLAFTPGDCSYLSRAILLIFGWRRRFPESPTAFPVEANGKRYYANCVWDAYGIAVALHADAIIPASDGHTGEPLTLEVKNNQPVLHPYVAHFAVPAAQWWDDIVFT